MTIAVTITPFQLARTPTPQGMRAYTHFQRDFDKIRALTAHRGI